LDVQVGNGAKIAVITVDTYHLSLPSGLVLELNNCHRIPTLCKTIISSSCLEEVYGYEIIIKISVVQFIIMTFSMLFVHW
jgi:hypothetical protein